MAIYGLYHLFMVKSGDDLLLFTMSYPHEPTEYGDMMGHNIRIYIRDTLQYSNIGKSPNEMTVEMMGTSSMNLVSGLEKSPEKHTVTLPPAIGIE